MLRFALALLQAATPDSVLGAGSPSFDVPAFDAEITVDGALDEAAWARAARLTGFHGYQPADQRLAEERTEVLVWYSPTAIHFGIRAYDRQPDAVRATLADRDNIAQEDRVTILLDTFDDARRAFLFAVNPLGVQQDGVRSEGSATAGNPFGGSIDLSPDYTWQSAGRRTTWGWQAEVRIPFRSLRYASGSEQRWGLQLLRDVQRTGHQDTWTDARRGSSSFLGQSGTMTGLRDLRHGVVVEGQPFVTLSSNRLRDDAGALRRDGTVLSTGANARFGFANAAIDATVNPDFSQIESDAGLVTANERFALFVPERRPFFLEGIELFASPNQLVYTRRIADPVAGAKLTGKWGPWGVAYLSAVDDAALADRDPLFNVLRVRRDVGDGSLIGATVSDRRTSAHANTVAAADARLLFAGKYYLEAQAGGSHTATDGSDTRNGAFWTATVDRTGRSFGFNYSLRSLDDGFGTEAGFIPRVGIVLAHAFNRFTWFGRPGGGVESVTTFFGPEYIWRSGDLGGGPIEGNEFVNTTLRLRGGWELSGRVGRDFVDFAPETYAGYELLPSDTAGDPLSTFVPADGLRGLVAGRIGVTTPVFQHVTGTAAWQTGAVPLFAEAAEGRIQRFEVSARVRPTTQLRGELSTVWQRLTRDALGGEYARTVIPRARVEYQPMRALFFRVVGEYQAERRAGLRDPVTGQPIFFGAVQTQPVERNGLRLETLASFEPTPGTVAFLGYAVNFAEPDPLAFRDLSAQADGLFLKLAYQFRW